MGLALDSIISPGCIVSGGRVVNCVMSPDVRVNSFANCEQSILMHGCDVGRYARLKKVIVEKGVQIPPGTKIGFDAESDARRYRMTESGVVVVEQKDFAE